MGTKRCKNIRTIKRGGNRIENQEENLYKMSQMTFFADLGDKLDLYFTSNYLLNYMWWRQTEIFCRKYGVKGHWDWIQAYNRDPFRLKLVECFVFKTEMHLFHFHILKIICMFYFWNTRIQKIHSPILFHFDILK